MNHSYKFTETDFDTAHVIMARKYFSGFELAHDTYNALTAASDGKIYYILCSESIDAGGQFFCYDPLTDQTKFIGDLTAICGESALKAIPQGKSHVEFYEWNGKLYFSTHIGYYEMIDGMERLPRNPPGEYKVYPGGHFISYDLATGELEDLATCPDGEGVLTMTLDQERGQIYAITWPTGNLIHYDVAKKKLANLGLTSANGEAGIPGKDYRVLCRSMFVDPKEGTVYYSTAEGDIVSFTPTAGKPEKVKGVDLRLDYFGQYDPTFPGSMGYNWRKIFWHPEEEVAYGVHGNSGYLFRFDPRKRRIEIIERITSQPSRQSGMFDQFSYGYLGFQLGPDKETIYYLTGGPVYENGVRLTGETKIAKGASRGIENLHLVTFHLPTRKYTDHGPIFFDDGARPSYVNSIAVGHDGQVYMLARYARQGRIIQDLVSIPAVTKI
ncbi:MAG TPA: hypothetical protein VFT90_10960 [Chryseosolibacter sp.]|nr:hypothetical protein [Chryseosolibacter sp.]